MKGVFWFVFVSVVIAASIPVSHCSKKPVGVARKEDIPYIKCQVCEKLAKHLYQQVENKKAEIAPKKISEYQIIEIAENVCNLKKVEADWILRIDIVEKGDRLELEEHDSEGQCNSECKTIERACQEVIGYSDTDVAEYLYKSKSDIDSLFNYLCKDLTKACSTKPPSLQELIPHLQLFLIEKKKNWMEQNFNLIYKTSFENNSFLKLQDFCTELITKEPEKIFNSVDFISLSGKSLISLIQHDNIQKNVIQVWEHVLKWGIAQNPGLSSDPSSYSKDDFINLKNNLQQFIPFINFFNLTSKEYLDKVYPYKKVIPKDLRENLFKYFMDQQSNNPEPNIINEETSSKNIDSKIITIKHAQLISRWIDRLEITDRMENSYDFKLILRGSRDGFSPSKFHEICDNQYHTITIIKVEDSNEILGGYNPIMWTSNIIWGVTKDSFIFSFKNKENIGNYILSRVKNENYAIENDSSLGPTFGDGDLELNGKNHNKACYYSRVYEKQIRETEDNFSVEEYEIFQIIKD